MCSVFLSVNPGTTMASTLYILSLFGPAAVVFGQASKLFAELPLPHKLTLVWPVFISFRANCHQVLSAYSTSRYLL